jgi:SHAQKYF class myb-like DNA-binding protein
MSNKHSDLPSPESTSTAANQQPLRPDGMCLHPMANGQSRECSTGTNSTQRSTFENNHVSASADETGERASNRPHGDASEVSLNESAPQNEIDGCAQLETSQEEKRQLKAKEEDEPNDSKETSEEICVSEPKEQRATSEMKKSYKMYEIPLTIMPLEGSRNKKRLTKEGQTNGRWTHEEHQAFLEGLKVFGREWKKVADRIPTRTSAQIRSHAQKYFSKISRDETMVMQEAPLPAVAQQPVAIDELPSSVQRNVERILANPTSVQAEVENTLRQLRERYRQLQIRLEESQRRGMPPLGRIVEDGENDDGASGAVRPDMDHRKRSFEDSSIASGYQNDDASSVSELSASFASLSPKRELDDEELIALHVLGGTLSRSASGTELQLGAHSRSSSFSEGEDSETKRRRLAESNDQGEPDRDQDGDHIL